MTRQRIFEIVEKSKNGDKISRGYDRLMLLGIAIGIIPLTISAPSDSGISVYQHYHILMVMDIIAASIFIIDYLLRWFTSDIRIGKKGIKAFILYPFSFYAIVDLLSILPSFNLIGNGFVEFRLARLLRVIRVLRVVQYWDGVELLLNVLRKERKILLSVLILAIFYIFITGLIMFQADPVFLNKTFFEALYWATTALTTVGYGDIFPTTNLGRLVSMLSSLFGIAIIALPSGIITASFLEEMNKTKCKNNPQND